MRFRFLTILFAVLIITGCKNKKSSDSQSNEAETSEVFDEVKYLNSQLNERTLDLITKFGSRADSSVYAEDLNIVADLVKKKNNLENIHFTSSGVVYILHKEGEGEVPHFGDVLQVQTETVTIEGEQVFSTSDLNQPLQFVLGTSQIVPAWNLVYRHIKEGSEFEIISPSAMSYGKNGVTGAVSPDAILVYRIKFEKIISTVSREKSSDVPGLDIQNNQKGQPEGGVKIK